jgi:hypothetical protein
MIAGASSSWKSSMSVLEVQELLPSALNFCTQASNQHGSKHNPNFVGPIQSCCMIPCKIQRNSKEEFQHRSPHLFCLLQTCMIYVPEQLSECLSECFTEIWFYNKLCNQFVAPLFSNALLGRTSPTFLKQL